MLSFEHVLICVYTCTCVLIELNTSGRIYDILVSSYQLNAHVWLYPRFNQNVKKTSCLLMKNHGKPWLYAKKCGTPSLLMLENHGNPSFLIQKVVVIHQKRAMNHHVHLKSPGLHWQQQSFMSCSHQQNADIPTMVHMWNVKSIQLIIKILNITTINPSWTWHSNICFFPYRQLIIKNIKMVMNCWYSNCWHELWLTV